MTAIETGTTYLVQESKRAYQILHLGYTVAPILFGLDKFLNLMTDWVDFLPAFVTDAVSGPPSSPTRSAGRW